MTKKPGKLVFSFSGALVAEASTEGGWERHTELRLYRTKVGYLLQIVGGSPIPGEEERHRYIQAKSPHEVVKVLRMQKSEPHSNVARELLRLAKKSDDNFKRDWEERHGSRKTGSAN